MKTGYTHVYTGENWRSLDTAFGMAARACGAGFSVCFYNFSDSAAHFNAFAQRLQIDSFQDIGNATQHDMAILYNCDFLDADALKNFLARKPQHQEVVLCGKAFDEEILAMADLISKVGAL
ncbi:MAG: cob(I)yrinic acid a,c-diamide adenosyltransferase [Defluviitaleaceae bacterium]|nr:cob(I)yrinic acid a,c-diamide adenosyltransferase [Defluviitaleaceae bacterium]